MVKFRILTSEDDETVNANIERLSKAGVNVRFVTKSHIVNEFGKIENEVAVVHCEASKDLYSMLKTTNLSMIL